MQEQEYKLTYLSLRRLVAVRTSYGLCHDPASIFLLSVVIQYAGQEFKIALDLLCLLLFSKLVKLIALDRLDYCQKLLQLYI